MGDRPKTPLRDGQAPDEYTAEAITVLKGLDNVRKRPEAVTFENPVCDPASLDAPRLR